MPAPFNIKKLDPKQKKQAIIAASLFAVIVLLAVWDFRGSVATTSAHTVQPRADVSASHAKLKNAASSALPSSFHLKLDELARAESIEYSANTHNLFSSAPTTPIETPIASPRPSPVLAPTPLVAKEAPAKPTIDIKYQGYAVSEPGKMDGLFMRGDDMSVARAGDIIFHRFRVVSIQPSSAQLTDLVSNQTQPVLVASAK